MSAHPVQGWALSTGLAQPHARFLIFAAQFCIHDEFFNKASSLRRTPRGTRRGAANRLGAGEVTGCRGTNAVPPARASSLLPGPRVSLLRSRSGPPARGTAHPPAPVSVLVTPPSRGAAPLGGGRIWAVAELWWLLHPPEQLCPLLVRLRHGEPGCARSGSQHGAGGGRGASASGRERSHPAGVAGQLPAEAAPVPSVPALPAHRSPAQPVPGAGWDGDADGMGTRTRMGWAGAGIRTGIETRPATGWCDCLPTPAARLCPPWDPQVSRDPGPAAPCPCRGDSPIRHSGAQG